MQTRCISQASVLRRMPLLLVSSALLLSRAISAQAHGAHGSMEGMDMSNDGEVIPLWTRRIAAHAALMSLALFGGMPIGVVLAWRGSHMHKWVQSGTLGMIFVAAALAWADVDAEGHGHGQSVHAKLGISTLSLFLLQGALGWATKAAKTHWVRKQASLEASAASAAANGQIADASTAAARINSLPSSSNLLSSLGSKSSSDSLPPTRSYAALSLAHRVMAGFLLLFLAPLTAVVGLVMACGLISPTDHSANKNLLAHNSFGAALILGGIASFIVNFQQPKKRARGAAAAAGAARGAGATTTNNVATEEDGIIVSDAPLEGGAPLLSLPVWMSLQSMEYAIWIFSSIALIISMHDWTTPMEYDGMDIQHVMMGLFALLSSISGMVSTKLTRAKLRREAADVLASHPTPEKVRAFRTFQTSHALLSRLPAVTIYLGLGVAMLGHAHGEPFSDTLHFAFAGYCIVYGLMRVAGGTNLVHFATPVQSVDSVPSAVDEENPAVSTGGSWVPASASFDNTASSSAAGSSSSTPPRGGKSSREFAGEAANEPGHIRALHSTGGVEVFHTLDDQSLARDDPFLEDGQTLNLMRSASPAAVAGSFVLPMSSTEQRQPLSQRQEQIQEREQPAPALQQQPVIDWSNPEGLESGGHWNVLAVFFIMCAGVTLCGSTKYGLIAAGATLSPVLYLVLLGVLTLLILTWVSAIAEAAVEARLKRERDAKTAASGTSAAPAALEASSTLSSSSSASSLFRLAHKLSGGSSSTSSKGYHHVSSSSSHRRQQQQEQGKEGERVQMIQTSYASNSGKKKLNSPPAYHQQQRV